MDKLQIEIKRLKRKLGTWSKVGNELGISRSHAWRVAHGKSDSVKARHYFNLPPKQVLIEPCRVCGEVHRQKTCANRRKKESVDRMPARLSKNDGKIARKKLARHGLSITDFWKLYANDECAIVLMKSETQ